MKNTNWLGIVLLAALIAAPGCGKKETPPPPVAQETAGVLIKLRAALRAATPEVQAAVSEVTTKLNAHDYPGSLTALEKLSNMSSLTPIQKQIVEDAMEQVKLVASKAPPTPKR